MNRELVAKELLAIAKELSGTDRVAGIPALDNEVINKGLKGVLEYLADFAGEAVVNANADNDDAIANAKLMSKELYSLSRKCKV